MRDYTVLVNSPKSGIAERLEYYEGIDRECPPYMHPYGRGLDSQTVLKVDIYKSGSRIHWPLEVPVSQIKEMPERKASLSQSAKSRLNAAWKIGNADTEWYAMTTLTYPKTYWDSLTYKDVVSHRTKFKDSVRSKYPKQDTAWILEFTKAGAPHFHFFWGDGPLTEAIKSEPKRKIERHGNKTEVANGQADMDIVGWWSNHADDCSVEFLKYQTGGITEVLRFPEGAAAYVAKEAGKREQKDAPWHVGAWWGLGPNSIKPVLEETITMTVEEYINRYGEVMLSKLFERAI